jgi:hypothetical protein
VKNTALPILLCATLSLSACATISESRFNPLNWFGSSTSVPTTANGEIRPLVAAGTQIGEVDRRGLIDTVSEMRIERTPNGALVRATGIAATAGQFNAQLVPVGFEGGTLTLAFRIETPPNAQAGGPTATRAITAARALDFGDLAGVSRIEVQGVRNTRIARR